MSKNQLSRCLVCILQMRTLRLKVLQRVWVARFRSHSSAMEAAIVWWPGVHMDYFQGFSTTLQIEGLVSMHNKKMPSRVFHSTQTCYSKEISKLNTPFGIIPCCWQTNGARWPNHRLWSAPWRDSGFKTVNPEGLNSAKLISPGFSPLPAKLPSNCMSCLLKYHCTLIHTLQTG